ncbi:MULTISPECIES: WhiB family transcriptional regulator [Streptomyces]|uniref:WhiB family transcriptional regulator n=1 Tax=Streptomyces TaxID=1883 RepID=UPI00067D77DB|nr:MULTISPECIES: WhiB family transcriptional regulator [Streptomyces]KOT47128.1 WhiB family transcriptional regulator [Streptomyces rimosus subsp. rimosus]
MHLLDAPRDAVTAWQTLGACRGEDPDLFFPVGDTDPACAQVAEAKAVCRRCSVMGICKDWALTTGEEHGVWGGLSEDERRNIRRHWARSGAGR